MTSWTYSLILLEEFSFQLLYSLNPLFPFSYRFIISVSLLRISICWFFVVLLSFNSLKNIYLFSLFFWLHRVLVAACGIFVEACGIFHCGTGSALWCAGFSLVVACGFSLSSCGAWAPGCVGSVVCGMRALLLRRTSSVVVARGLSSPVACGILVPWPGIKLVSPALEGRFFTTGPPGKSHFPLTL